MGDQHCCAWGFARREHGVEPTGSPASFGYEGLEGDNYLRLKQGQSAPGLSGAPLLCTQRRAVVGVISASRDIHSDLGGWAAPVSALWLGGPGVPTDLVDLGGQIRVANRDSVVAGRDLWHAVLPVTDVDDLLDQPWADFTRERQSSPSSLLLAEHAVVPYLFRARELDDAVAWCEQPTPMSMTRVAGRGGAGKTRFAIELCKTMTARGWLAGMWRADRSAAAAPVPRVVVVDYAEAVEPTALRSALDDLRRRASDVAPVRVLLLTRTRAGGTNDPLNALREQATATLQRVVDGSDDSDVADTALTLPERRMLYQRALASFRDSWFGDRLANADGPDGDVPDLSGEQFALALEVLFAAFDDAISRGDGSSERSPVERVLVHEQRYWDATAPHRERISARERSHCVALATLVGASTPQDAHALLRIVPTLLDDASMRTAVVTWLSDLYEGADVLNPLRPDRLGEALVARMLRETSEGEIDVLGAVVGLADDQVVRTMDVLTRLSASDAKVAARTARMLATHNTALVTRAQDQAAGRPGRPGRHDLANALLRPLAHQLGFKVREALARDEPTNTTYQRDLAISYERLGDLALQSGQASEAERLYRQSLDVREALARDEPTNTTYQRDLAISYNKLADLALQSGQASEAERLYRQSLDVGEALARDEPTNTTYQRDLAVSYEQARRPRAAVRASQRSRTAVPPVPRRR